MQDFGFSNLKQATYPLDLTLIIFLAQLLILEILNYFDLGQKKGIFADENLTLKGIIEIYKLNA